MLEGFGLFFGGIMRRLFHKTSATLVPSSELTSKPTTISLIETNDLCDHIAL
jgi:hypothetical protein